MESKNKCFIQSFGWIFFKNAILYSIYAYRQEKQEWQI